jgi:hypothetical protein
MSVEWMERRQKFEETNLKVLQAIPEIRVIRGKNSGKD